MKEINISKANIFSYYIEEVEKEIKLEWYEDNKKILEPPIIYFIEKNFHSYKWDIPFWDYVDKKFKKESDEFNKKYKRTETIKECVVQFNNWEYVRYPDDEYIVNFI